jgi:hypothetical protein
MKREDFEQQLRFMMSEQPFHPFEVELADGRVLAVDRRVTVGGGAAGYLTDDGEFVKFTCDEVRAIRPARSARDGQGMPVEQFEDTLRHYLRKKPFEPFEVELLDGRIIKVKRRKVMFAGGNAAYIKPGPRLVEFTSAEVRAIRPAVREAST